MDGAILEYASQRSKGTQLDDWMVDWSGGADTCALGVAQLDAIRALLSRSGDRSGEKWADLWSGCHRWGSRPRLGTVFFGD